jgi:hypothetical membrane protein
MTALHPSPRFAHGATAPRSSAAVVIGAFLFFWAAVAVGAALNPGYSNVGEYISALASRTAAFPGVMITGIAALAVGIAIAGVALARRLRRPWAHVAGALLVLSGAVGLVAAVAQQDCSTALAACQAREVAGSTTGQHVLHELSALAAFVLAWQALLPLAVSVRRARLRAVTLTAALVGLGLLVWLVLGDPGSVAGLAQRGFVLTVYGVHVLLVAAHRGQPAGSAA